MKLYDVSVDIHDSMHAYPDDPRYESKQLKSLSNGDLFDLHVFCMSNHCGTHVDAPAHFIPGGATISELSLELMNGRCRVIQVRNGEKVDLPELKKLVLMDDFRVLLKTRNSHLWRNPEFSKDYIYLTADAASYLVDNGVKLVGFDYLSVDRYGDDSFPVHQRLLENNIILVEGLNLSEVEEDEYEMSCLPLRLKDLDAAPARVILRK